MQKAFRIILLVVIICLICSSAMAALQRVEQGIELVELPQNYSELLPSYLKGVPESTKIQILLYGILKGRVTFSYHQDGTLIPEQEIEIEEHYGAEVTVQRDVLLQNAGVYTVTEEVTVEITGDAPKTDDTDWSIVGSTIRTETFSWEFYNPAPATRQYTLISDVNDVRITSTGGLVSLISGTEDPGEFHVPNPVATKEDKIRFIVINPDEISEGGNIEWTASGSATWDKESIVEGVNISPDLRHVDNVEITEGQLWSGTFVAPDIDGASVTFSWTGLPTGAFLSPNNGGYTFTPTYAQSGVYQVTLTATDGFSETSKVFEVTVTEVTDQPVANPDEYSTDEDTTLTVTAPGVLGNDSDPDGDPLTAVIDSTTSNGTLTLNPNDGSFTYEPNLNFNGTDSFTYHVNDGRIDSNTVTVTINVTSINDAPIATDDTNQTDEDTLLTVNAPGLLDNDTDPDTGDTLSVSEFDATSIQGATVAVNADGSYTYDPTGVAAFNALAVGEAATDTFEYTVSDGNGGTDTATVTITVNGVNDAPIANDDTAGIFEDSPPIDLTATLLDNDTDIDASDVLSIDGIDTTQVIGSVSLVGGVVTYAPNGQFEHLAVGETATDTFEYTVSDGNGGTDTATVTITVIGVNDPPVLAEIGTLTINENETKEFSVSATDIDSTNINLELSGEPVFASLQHDGRGNGTLTLSPDFGDSGVYDNVTIRATDDALPPGVDSKTFTITVIKTDRPATITITGPNTIEETETLSLLISYSDPDGDALTIHDPEIVPPGGISTQDLATTFGLTAGFGEGATEEKVYTFTFTPNYEQAGDYTVTFGVTADERLASESVDITVTDKNQDPILTQIGGKSVDEGVLLTFDVTASDPNEDVLTFIALGLNQLPGTPGFEPVSPPLNLPDYGYRFIWTPPSAGIYSLTFKVDDGEGGVAFETVEIAVGAVNHNPVLEQIGGVPVLTGRIMNFTATEGVLLELPIIASDPDDDTLTFESSDLSVFRVAEFDEVNGVFSWRPGFDQAIVEDYTVTLTVKDDETPPGEDSATVYIAVANVNQAPILTIDDQAVQDGAQLAFGVEEGGTLSFSVVASDPDAGETATVTASGTLAGNFDSGTNRFTYSPDFTAGRQNPYDVTFTATDGDLSVSAEVAITVADVNQAPTLTVTADSQIVQGGKTARVNVNEGQTLTFTVQASDPDAGETVAITTSGDLAANLVEGADNQYTYSPDFTAGGQTLDVTFTATDSRTENSLSVSATIFITVIDVNQAPVVTIDPGDEVADEPTVPEGEKLSFEVEASDLDGDTVTLSASLSGGGNLPPGANFPRVAGSPATGLFSFEPKFEDNLGGQSFNVLFSATDGKVTSPVTETITISVTEVNRAPEIDEINDVTVNINDIQTINITSRDPDGDGINLKLTVTPAKGHSFVKLTDNKDGTGTLELSPKDNDVGAYDVAITATDDGQPKETASETFTITVVDPTSTLPVVSSVITDGNKGNIQIKFTLQDADTAAGIQVAVGFAEEGSNTFTPANIVEDISAGFPPGAHTIIWNSVGNNAGTGSITSYVVKLTPNDGNEGFSATSKPFLVDNVPPDVTHTPVATAYTGAVISIQANVTDNHEISSATININGTDFSMDDKGNDVFEYKHTVPIDSIANIAYSVGTSDTAGNVARSPIQDGQFHTITVEDNINPTAVATASTTTIDPGKAITTTPDIQVSFDGSNSTDNIRVESYKWDFDDSDADGVDFDSPDATGWDANHTYGEPGVYIATLQVVDNSGLTDTDTVTITVLDNVPPAQPIITSPAPPDNIIARKSFTVGGSAEADSTVDILLNGVSRARAQADGDGAFSINISVEVDGEYQISATATDSWGNTSIQSDAVSVTVDTVPPVITFLSPGEIVSTHSVEAKATVQDLGSGVKDGSVKLVIQQAGGAANTVTPTFENSIASYTIPNLIHGLTYNLILGADDETDKHHVAAITSFRVNFFAEDTTPPTATTAQDGKTFNTSQPKLIATLTDAESGIDPGSIQVSLTTSGGGLVDVIPPEFDPNNGRLSIAPTAPLDDGGYTVSVTFTDKNGIGLVTEPFEWSFTIDTTPPESPTLLSPGDDTQIPTTSIALVGTSEPGATVRAYVNDEPKGSGNADAATGDFNFRVDLTEGRNIITLRAIDGVGNIGPATDEVIVIRDTQAPVITNMSPTGAIGDDTPTISAVIADSTAMTEDVSGVATITLNIDNQQINPDGGNGYSYDATSKLLTYTPDTPYDDSTSHDVLINVSDNVGNSPSQPVEFTFSIDLSLSDIDPPTISEIRPKSNSVVNTDSPEISATIFDAISGVNADDSNGDGFFDGIIVRIDGTRVQPAFEENTGRMSHQTSGLSEGSHSVTIKAIDKAAAPNESPQVGTVFTVKTQVPQPTLDVAQLPELTNVDKVNISGTAEADARVTIYKAGIPLGTVKAGADDGTFAMLDVQLSEGDNVFTAQAEDDAQNKSPLSAPVTVTLDTTPPRVGYFTPATGTRTNQTQPTLSAVVSDESGIGRFILKVDSVQVAGVLTGQLLTYTPGTPLVEGEHSFSVYVEDRAGNDTFAASGTFYVDITGPIIAGIQPADGDVISNQQPNISATVLARDLNSRTIIGILDGPSAITFEPDFDDSTGQISYQPQTTLLPGEYTLIIRASDTSNNLTEVSINFTIDIDAVDTTEPVVSGQFPEPGTVVNTTNIDAVSFVIADADSGVDPNSIIISINGVPVSLAELLAMRIATFNRATGKVVINLRRLRFYKPQQAAPQQQALSLANGENTIVVKGADQQGNLTENSWSFLVVTEAPEAPIIDAPTTPTNSASINVTGQVPEATGDITVTLLLNGVAFAETPIDAEAGGTEPRRYEVEDVTLKKGKNTITAYAEDAAGNQSDLAEAVTVTLDVTSPQVTIEALPKATSQTELEVKGTITDNLDLPFESVSVVVNEVPQAVEVSGSGQVSFAASVHLVDGDNTISVEAQDAAGNKGASPTVVVKVDAIPLNTAPTNLTARVGATGLEIITSWEIDPQASSYNVYRQMGIPITDATGLSPIASSIAEPALTDDDVARGITYFYAVTSKDEAGNEGPSIVSNSPNMTLLLTEDGGSAVLQDGTRVTFGSNIISTDPTLSVGVSIEKPASKDVPPLQGAIPGSIRRISSIAQDGSVIGELTGTATLVLSYPDTVDDTKPPQVYILIDGNWDLLGDQATDTNSNRVIANITRLGTYRLVSPAEAFNEFTLNLVKGLNFISVPLKPDEDWRLSDLAEFIGSDLLFIVRYDSDTERFRAYLPGFHSPSSLDNVPISGAEGYLVQMKASAEVTFRGKAWDGAASYSEGINLISVPLMPEEPWQLSNLASFIGVDNVVLLIWYDAEVGQFRAYMPDQIFDKPVKGGEGYLMILKTPETITYQGSAWQGENTPPSSAPVMGVDTRSGVALSRHDFGYMPILLLSGLVNVTRTNNINVSVRNLTTGKTAADRVRLSEYGAFTIVFQDIFDSRGAASIGDQIEITVSDVNGVYESRRIIHTVTSSDIAQNSILLGEIELSILPKQTILAQNYPNPFNPETWIPYQLSEGRTQGTATTVTIKIYNLSGQLVRTLNIGDKQPGFYMSKEKAAYWNGRNEADEQAANGIYFYRIEAGDFSSTKKMILAK